MKLISIGYGSFIAAERIITILAPDSSPIKRLVQDAKENGLLIDASYGKKTMSVLVTDTAHVILSSETPDVISERVNSDEEE